MAIIGLKLDAERNYESNLDSAKGTKEATVFQIGTLDSRIFGRIKDQATRFVVDPNAPNDEVETAVNASEVNFQTVQYGLRGWKNLRDDAGNDIPYKTVKRTHGGQSYRVCDPEQLKLVPQAVIEELAHEIARSNEVSEAQEKN